MTGVSATASSPSSTLSRVISKKLPRVKKFGAIAAKSAISTPSASSRIHSPFGTSARARPAPSGAGPRRDGGVRRPRARSASTATAARMIAPWIARSQYALTPRNVSAGPIAPSRTTPSSVPATACRGRRVIAAPPTTTAAITFISRPRPALLGIWLKRTALSSAASPVSAPATVKTAHFTRGGVEAGEPRGLRVRAGGVDRAAGREMPQRPRRTPTSSTAAMRDRDDGIGRLRQAEPLEARRQILHPRALGRPAQPVAQRHHRRQRDDDRRDAAGRRRARR